MSYLAKKINYDFEKNIKQGTLHHAFIIEAPFTVDKLEIAKRIAMASLCKAEIGKGCGVCNICRKIINDNYIDLYMVEPEKSNNSSVLSIKNEAIIKLQENLQKKPVEGERNIAIIRGADLITERGYNRLLKTIEEPPIGTLILFLSENIRKMPQTIRSRCIHIRPITDYFDIKCVDTSEAFEIVMLILDNDYFYKKKKLIEKFAKESGDAFLLLDAMEKIYMDMLFNKYDESKRFTKEYIYRAISSIEEARNEIQMKLNISYALKKMILNIGGK